METLEEQVMAQMKDAMKSKDEALLRGLRAIKAEIIKAKTDPGAGGSITTEGELKLLCTGRMHPRCVRPTTGTLLFNLIQRKRRKGGFCACCLS